MNKNTTHWRRLVRTIVALALVAFVTGCATSTRPVAAGRLYHVGLVWLKEPGSAEHRQRIVEAAHAFAREIPEVRLLAVGQAPPSTSPYVDDSFDVCVVMEFADKAALERYNRHPVHVKAAQEAFLPLSRKIQFYDFISE
jgi:hypothetical protein